MLAWNNLHPLLSNRYAVKYTSTDQKRDSGICETVLEKHGIYDINGLEEIAKIDDFKDRAYAIQRGSREQTLDDVAELRKKYQQPIFGEMRVERLMELFAQIVDPTNFFLFCGSQLTHTLQVFESMEQAGITDKEFLATTLIHDLGKLAALKGETWENSEGGGKIPLGNNVPGSGFSNCTFNWDHADVVHARFAPHVLKTSSGF